MGATRVDWIRECFEEGMFVLDKASCLPEWKQFLRNEMNIQWPGLGGSEEDSEQQENEEEDQFFEDIGDVADGSDDTSTGTRTRSKPGTSSDSLLMVPIIMNVLLVLIYLF